MKKINISVLPPVQLPANLMHIGTEYKISKDLFFKEDELLVNVINNVNLYECKFTLDISDDDTVYVVTRYQYIKVDEHGDALLDNEGNFIYKFSTPSAISPVLGKQSGVKISDTIVSTPKVKLKENFDYTVKGRVEVLSSDFKMFSSAGEHKSSSYLVTDIYGNHLYKRDKDEDNLTSIILPEGIEIKDNFIVYVTHHSDTNADSNCGMYINMVSTKLPLYSVEMYGELWIGVEAQFRIKLINSLYSNVSMETVHRGTVIATYDNIVDFLFSKTDNFIVGDVYTFNFSITSKNGTVFKYSISKVARAYKERFPSRDYLDKYDYSGLFITGGLTKTLSYQLINNAILLFKNNTRYLSLAKYVNIRENNNLQYVGDLVALPVSNNIVDPSTFIGELLTGDVIVAYSSRDAVSFGKIFVNVYEHNFFNNHMRLKNSIQLPESDELVLSGSIITSGNLVYYVKYNALLGNKIIELNPYTGVRTEKPLPIYSTSGISISADLDNNIYALGGTSDDVSDYTIFHKRDNDKVMKLNLTTNTWSELGIDLLKIVDKDIYQFHLAPRHGNEGFTLFNTTYNSNHNAIDDQSTFVLDLFNKTLEYKNNDHLDNLPYANTVVMVNGDVIRYASIDSPVVKVYTYIANSRDVFDIDDEGNIIRDGNNLIVKDDTTIPKFDLCMYDKVIIEPRGKLVIVSEDGDDVCYSDTLVITRDTVMDRIVEFDAKGYVNVVIACPNASLILK